MPSVTIAIPTFNRSQLLRRAVQSVISQTYSDWELLIVDNDSTDDTSQVCAGFSKKDKRISHIKNPENIGLAGNFSKAATLGTGNFVLLLADDDMLDADFLEKCVLRFTTVPDAAMVCGRRVPFTARRVRTPYKVVYEGLIEAGGTLPRALRSGNLYGIYSTVMFRRSALEFVGGIRQNNDWCADFEVFLRISAEFPVWFEPTATVRVLWYQGNTTTSLIRNGRVISDEMGMLKRLFASKTFRGRVSSTDVLAAWARLYALGYLLAMINILRGHFASARRCMEETRAVSKEAKYRPSLLILAKYMIRLAYCRITLSY